MPIRSLIQRLHAIRSDAETPADDGMNRLRTDLCGIPLENPFLLSSSVLASSYDMCARAFDMGWAGAAYKTVSSWIYMRRLPAIPPSEMAAARAGSALPILAKLTPNTGNMREAALAAKRGGANGLAAINTNLCA